MKRGVPRRRPATHITLSRAARLHRLVSLLGAQPRTRERILSDLSIGLRTFYRELELLKKVGVKVRLTGKLYELQTSLDEAEGRLPFPDPQLSFAEMAELAKCPCEAGKRLADLLASVVAEPVPPASRKRKSGTKKGTTKPSSGSR